MALESENMLQKAIDNAPVMVLTVDQNGMITSLAGAGLIDLESRPDQVLGQPYPMSLRIILKLWPTPGRQWQKRNFFPP